MIAFTIGFLVGGALIFFFIWKDPEAWQRESQDEPDSYDQDKVL